MASVGEFLSNPLVTWVNTFRSSSPAESISDFADGVFLNEVMIDIDPTYFTLTRVHQNIDGDLNVRMQNLDILVRHLKAFYQEKLQQLILLRAPDVVTIAHDPESDVSLQELIKILLLMLGCAVQSDKKEHFIEKIKELDFEVQKNLVEFIKEITEKTSNVLTFRVTELAELPLDQFVEFAENMFYQLCHIVEDRDDLAGMVTHLSIEKDALLQDKQNLKSQRPFSPPLPLAQHPVKDSPSVSATKEKLRLLTEELEEKNVAMSELRDELVSNKKTIEKVRQENKELSQDARWVKAYRDEMDMLKSKAERVEKLESDAGKYRDKLRDLDYLKKRAEELKEENELLYDNKLLLEQQLDGLASKDERIEILEEENKKLKSHIYHIAEERQNDQARVKEMMEENAQLVIDKQESMAELFSLSAELDILRGKSSTGGGPVTLASECNESSSMDVLRLSQQNQHLKKSLEDLRGSSAKVIELERENRNVHDKLLQEKSTVHRLNEDLAKYKAKSKKQAAEIEKLSRTIHTLREELHMSSSEVLNLSGELKERGQVIADLEQVNYSQSSEINEKLDDVVVKEENMVALTQEVLTKEQQLANLDQKNKEKDVIISEMSKRVQDKKETLIQMENTIVDKDKQLRSLQSRLGESAKDQQKSEEAIKKQKKEINELENRLEEIASQKKKSEEQIKRKEKEIAELEKRFEESHSQVNRTNDKLRKKEKEVYELKNRLEVATDDNDRLAEEMKAKDLKIQALQKRVDELTKLLEESTEKLGGSLRDKDKQNRQLERRIEELNDVLEEAERLKEALDQKEEKISSLCNNYDAKEKQLREIETRLEDSTSESKKLQHVIKLKEKKIEVLESSLSEIENSSVVQKDDRIAEVKRTVEVKDNRIVELENRLEDLESANNKSNHSVKIKEEKIADLEQQIDDLETLTSEKNRLCQSLDQKMRRILDLENSVEDLTSENQRLHYNSTQKSQKVQALESKITELEHCLGASEELQQTIRQKDEKISTLNRIVLEREERLAELEHGLEDAQAHNHKLSHSVKIKEEKIAILERRIEELECLVDESQKLNQIVQQKEEKLKALETKLDEFEEVVSDNDKMYKNLKQKEEKIDRLQERLDEVQDAVNMNANLNKSLKNRDEKIKALGKRILELDEDAEAKEKQQMALAQANYKRIRDLETRLEQTSNVKVQRQHSVKRRDDKIVDLETRRTKLEEYVQEKEGKIHDLQSRLDGSVNQFRRLDMTIGEKEMKIAELEAELIESQQAARENRRLNQIMKTKDARLTQLENNMQTIESTSTKLQKEANEKDEKIEGLQKRLEETLNLNNKLDQSVRKKEENIRTLEKTLQSNEKREEELEVLLDTRTEKLSEYKKRVLELEDAIETKDDEIEEIHKRLDEVKNTTTAEEKRAIAVKEKDNEVQTLNEKLASLSKVSEQAERLEKLIKDEEKSLLDAQSRLEESEAENRKTSHNLKLKEQKIEALEKRVEELELNQDDTAQSQGNAIKKQETKITILTQSAKQQEADIFSLETKLDEATVQVNKLSRVVEQKDDRIQALKSRLEEAVHQNNKVTHALELKDDKIQALEKRLTEASKQQMQLREEAESKSPDRERDPKRKGGSSQTIIFRPADNTRNDRKTVEMLSVADRRIADLNDEIRMLEKQKTIVATQNESMSARNAQLEIENESLKNEVQTTKSDFASLQSDMHEARDYYHQLDLSAANMGHRCEMLGQLNGTLEEENKALHEKVNWLIGQNQDLMVRSLEDKDQFMEEERQFSDKLYNLQRTKEKLEEQIDLANKALIEATPKKKPNFFKKVLRKAGLKKKRDDPKSKNPVHLLRHEQYTDDMDSSTVLSDHHDESTSSLRMPFTVHRFDESSVASRDSSASGDSGRGLAPRSHQSEVILRRPRDAAALSPIASTSALMSEREVEMMKIRKVSHDMSAFRARKVRSEIYNDNFRPGKLVRPKSLDALDKLNVGRGSDSTLSGGSAATIEAMYVQPSGGSHRQYDMNHISPSASPATGQQAGPMQTSSPYSSPILARKVDTIRNTSRQGSSAVPSREWAESPPYQDSGGRRQPPPYPGTSTPVREQRSHSSPTQPSPPTSRRNSFSSAVSGSVGSKDDDSPVSRVTVDDKSPVTRKPESRLDGVSSVESPDSRVHDFGMSEQGGTDSRQDPRVVDTRRSGATTQERPSSARGPSREETEVRSPERRGADSRFDYIGQNPIVADTRRSDVRRPSIARGASREETEVRTPKLRGTDSSFDYIEQNPIVADTRRSDVRSSDRPSSASEVRTPELRGTDSRFDYKDEDPRVIDTRRSDVRRPSSARLASREETEVRTPEPRGAFIRGAEIRMSYSRRPSSASARTRPGSARDRSESQDSALVVAVAGVVHSTPIQHQSDLSSSMQGKVASPQIIRDESRMVSNEDTRPRSLAVESPRERPRQTAPPVPPRRSTPEGARQSTTGQHMMSADEPDVMIDLTGCDISAVPVNSPTSEHYSPTTRVHHVSSSSSNGLEMRIANAVESPNIHINGPSQSDNRLPTISNRKKSSDENRNDTTYFTTVAVNPRSTSDGVVSPVTSRNSEANPSTQSNVRARISTIEHHKAEVVLKSPLPEHPSTAGGSYTPIDDNDDSMSVKSTGSNKSSSSRRHRRAREREIIIGGPAVTSDSSMESSRSRRDSEGRPRSKGSRTPGQGEKKGSPLWYEYGCV